MNIRAFCFTLLATLAILLSSRIEPARAGSDSSNLSDQKHESSVSTNGQNWPSQEIIYSTGPGTIDAGSWSNQIDFCPPNQYVSAIRLLYEAYQGSADDTGINGVQMQCSDSAGVESVTLNSASGPFGRFWTEWVRCPVGHFIFQYQLKSEGTKGGRDLVAMTNIRASCREVGSSGIGVTAVLEPLLPTQLAGWGDYQSLARCPENKLIVGLQTRVMPRQGGGDHDDMGLTDLQLRCAF